MKICIPTKSNEGSSARVNEHFGSSPFFTIYDTESRTVETINNQDQHHAHGTCHPLLSLDGKNISAVICGGMGGRAVLQLNQNGIKAYRLSGGTVAETIELFQKGGLEEITPNNACAHHGGGCP
jgi:predicted Fe-Mo cluster-binding NifX family protein